MNMIHQHPAILAMEDGTIFRGYSFGARRDSGGEVVFNTSLSGYQEIITDPSYAGQMVVMTAPLIGNYGITAEDNEGNTPVLEAFIVRECSRIYSNYRARVSLHDFLASHDVPGIEGVDTRALTRHIRDKGAMRCWLSCSETDTDTLVDKARAVPTMEGADFVKKVTCKEPYTWDPDDTLSAIWQDAFRTHNAPQALPETRVNVVAIDCGIKHNLLRHLRQAGCRVTVVPAHTSAKDIRALSPDGVFVSNGPGDPAAVPYVFNELRTLIGHVPIFGICFGHQMLAHACGGKTYKMRFGHHGGNQPVMHHANEKVEITAQNHGFAVDKDSLPENDVIVTHTNLNDGSVEGIRYTNAPIFSVQYHPEAAPGPHDAQYLFTRFVDMCEKGTYTDA